ncbi:MAG: Vacuolar H+transporting two-sector ATPase F subunit [Magnetococcales bacterium]|nr:Vacuolar H+transporting two-sector ATPase F subunit [Magnetococcales bacterium]
MPAIRFVGDAVSAAAWRLAGVECWVPEAGEESAMITRLCLPPTQLLLLTAALAQRLPVSLQQRIFASLAPLVLVVPDVQMAVAMPDLVETVRKQLGVGA